MMSDVIGDDSLAANDRECWNTGHTERVEVIAAQKDDDVRLGLVQNFPKLTHRADAGLRLFRNFVRRPG